MVIHLTQGIVGGRNRAVDFPGDFADNHAILGHLAWKERIPPPMARESTEFRKIEARKKDLADWLAQNAPQCAAEQKHLEEGSQERAYWHYGYLVALRDVMRLMVGEDRPNQKYGKPDISNSHPAA